VPTFFSPTDALAEAGAAVVAALVVSADGLGLDDEG